MPECSSDGVVRGATVVWRKLRWRAHWATSRDPIEARWWADMKIVLPKTGAAATVYYRTFPSATIADWIRGVVKPGMVVVDVGAHAGVYTLLAARLVGPN